MASHNDVTGDALVSRQANANYRNNYDRIFGKKKENDNAGAGTNDATVQITGVSGTGCTGASSGAGSGDTV